MGFEGDCADQREAKTVWWTVFKESVDEAIVLNTPHKTRRKFTKPQTPLLSAK